MAIIPGVGEHILGNYAINIGFGSSTFNMDTAAKYFGYSFVVSKNKSLDRTRLAYQGTVGAPSAANLLCTLRADSGARTPDAIVIATATAVVAASNKITMTWGGVALTPGTYWVVISNTHATPATNYYQLLMQPSNSLPYYTGFGEYGFMAKTSLNSGGSWSSQATATASMLVMFSDGTADGMLASTSAAFSNRTYDARRSGAFFTTPLQGGFNLGGVSFYMSRIGSFPAAAYAEIWDVSANALLATSISVPAAAINTSASIIPYRFASPLLLRANKSYRAVVSQGTGNGTNSLAYSLFYQPLDASTEQQLAVPWQGTVQRTESLDSGATWTSFTSQMPFMGFILDADTPLVGGGVSRSRQVGA